LKFSYLTLRRDDAPLVSPVPGRRALRVVSGALDSKGVVERIVCGDEGRRRLRILRRGRSPALAALARSRRGDVLTTDDAGDLSPPASPPEPEPAPPPPPFPPPGPARP